VRSPPPSALFPYTTLFRSSLRLGDRQRPLQGQVEDLVDPLHRHDLDMVGDVGRNVRQILAVLFRDDDRGDAAAQRSKQLFLEPADRKSTRLNSSHVKISYA